MLALSDWESIMPGVYTFFSARGTHGELGRQHGEQCRDRILGFVVYLAQLLKLSADELRAAALRFLPLFERHCPHLVEEINGLADGASIPLADALAVQA